MMMEGDQTSDGECTMQCADDALQNCTLETCLILLTNVTPNKFNKNKLTKIKNHPFLRVSENKTKKTNHFYGN